MGHDPLNYRISRMYELCMKLWPVEFQRAYAGKRHEFNDWLNEKTGLNEDHSADRERAVNRWLDELEHMMRKQG